MEEYPKVLIADDEQECIDFVREALNDVDCEVISAMDGEEALNVAREQKPSVVILDVQMPKLDGFSVFSKLRADAALSSVPVIMLTAVTARTGIRTNADEMGDYIGSAPEMYIDKPIEPIVLKQAVMRLIR